MTNRGFVIGSAADPDAENKKRRGEVERAVRNTLMAAGVPEYLALETAGAVVLTYLTNGTEESLYVIKHLGSPTAVRLVNQLRVKGEGINDQH